MATRRQPPNLRLRRLAAALRALRAAVNLTREDVTDKTGINAATLYRIETAKTKPQRRTLVALLDLYRVTDETKRADLVALSKQAAQLDWLQAYESALPEQYSMYISFEAEAHSVRNFESQFVPGLLQTEDYARAVIRGVLPLASDDEVESRVAVRMQRQETLKKRGPLRLWAIIDEAVIARRVGGDDTMRDQLRALVDASEKPHITLQVIPFTTGAHPGMPGSFVVMGFLDAADPDLVYVDSMAGDIFLERDSEVDRYAAIFEHLQTMAVDPATSVRLIQAASAEME